MLRGVYIMAVLNMLARLVMAFLLVMLLVTLFQKLKERGELQVRIVKGT